MKNAEFFESRGRIGNQRTVVTSAAVIGNSRPALSRRLLPTGKNQSDFDHIYSLPR